MNKSRLKRLVAEMIVIVILSFAAVIGGIYLSASRKDERQQVLYKAEFFPVIQ